jgi:hypothetical protein
MNAYNGSEGLPNECNQSSEAAPPRSAPFAQASSPLGGPVYHAAAARGPRPAGTAACGSGPGPARPGSPS